MIYLATPGQTTAVPIANAAEERAVTSEVFRTAASGSPAPRISLAGFAGEQAEIKPQVLDVSEDYDWSNRKLQREFIHLEQKALAQKADAGELARYKAMKRNRNSQIFADRYVSDYAEVQRLKKLSEKLAEIQHYLRPIGF